MTGKRFLHEFLPTWKPPPFNRTIASQLNQSLFCTPINTLMAELLRMMHWLALSRLSATPIGALVR
jgi:hypothetical protein